MWKQKLEQEGRPFVIVINNFNWKERTWKEIFVNRVGCFFSKGNCWRRHTCSWFTLDVFYHIRWWNKEVSLVVKKKKKKRKTKEKKNPLYLVVWNWIKLNATEKWSPRFIFVNCILLIFNMSMGVFCWLHDRFTFINKGMFSMREQRCQK